MILERETKQKNDLLRNWEELEEESMSIWSVQMLQLSKIRSISAGYVSANHHARFIYFKLIQMQTAFCFHWQMFRECRDRVTQCVFQSDWEWNWKISVNHFINSAFIWKLCMTINEFPSGGNVFPIKNLFDTLPSKRRQ